MSSSPTPPPTLHDVTSERRFPFRLKKMIEEKTSGMMVIKLENMKTPPGNVSDVA